MSTLFFQFYLISYENLRNIKCTLLIKALKEFLTFTQLLMIYKYNTFFIYNTGYMLLNE